MHSVSPRVSSPLHLLLFCQHLYGTIVIVPFQLQQKGRGGLRGRGGGNVLGKKEKKIEDKLFFFIAKQKKKNRSHVFRKLLALNGDIHGNHVHKVLVKSERGPC